MQIQDGATAKLVGYQMERGHHGAIPELPEGGVVESPRTSGVQEPGEFGDEGELKAKVMEAPKQDKPTGVAGAETA